MDRYTHVLRQYLEILFNLWFQRIGEKLQLFAEALDEWLHDLFLNPTPDWCDRFAHFLAEQEAAGYIVQPQSRQDLLDWLERWAVGDDGNAQQGGQADGARPDFVDEALQNVGRRFTSPSRPFGKSVQLDEVRKAIAGGALFIHKLREAQETLDEMERVLQALGQKLDAAEIGEEVEVESAVDAIEALIWSHHDALEKARGAWLQHNLSHFVYPRIEQVSSPTSLNLPKFVDEQQERRATQQIKQIGRRLDLDLGLRDRGVTSMQVLEAAGMAANLLIGGGVLLQAARTGGKWTVVKTVAKVAAAGAVAHSHRQSGRGRPACRRRQRRDDPRRASGRRSGNMAVAAPPRASLGCEDRTKSWRQRAWRCQYSKER